MQTSYSNQLLPTFDLATNKVTPSAGISSGMKCSTGLNSLTIMSSSVSMACLGGCFPLSFLRAQDAHMARIFLSSRVQSQRSPSAPAALRVAARTVRTTSSAGTPRSEEHTSELQSLRHLVCRLLL